MAFKIKLANLQKYIWEYNLKTAYAINITNIYEEHKMGGQKLKNR